MYEQLQHVGLTGTESKIYVVLLDLHKGQAGVLSRKTGIHRRSIYDALDRLIEKGLVSYIVENGKRFYMPADPARLSEMIRLQQEAVMKLVPDLSARFNDHKGKQETQFYRGKEGLRSVFEDQISAGEDVFIIGASHLAKDLLKYYLPHYTNDRVKKKIKLHCLYAGERHTSAVPLSSVRYLPAEFGSLVSTNIWGDKVAIILWIFDPVAIVISQRDIALGFRNYFDALWKIAKV